MQTTRFVTVVQRREVTVHDDHFSKIEHLFKIETHLAMEERITLLEVALASPRNFTACEIGSYVGASTCFLGVAADALDGAIHCVDTWDNRAMGAEPPRDTLEEFQSNTAPFLRRITPHRGTSAAMARHIPSVDLLFIDGDHSHAACLADLQLYLPKLKPGGVLLLHDFNYPEVQRAASEALSTRTVRDMGGIQTLKGFQVLV